MSSYERDPITGLLQLIDGMIPLSTIWTYIKERLGISSQGIRTNTLMNKVSLQRSTNFSPKFQISYIYN